MKQGVLYISYDGMLEPLGQSQVLAYLKGLAPNRVIHLISFEKAADWNKAIDIQLFTAEIADAGIFWHPLRYHKWPSVLATAWDIATGIGLGLWLVLRHSLKVVHARSYVSSVIALVVKQITGAKYVFDMRGFWADEKVDGGSWKRDELMYKMTKGLERRFLLAADHVVSLTNAAVLEMQRFPYLQGRMPPITVIPTCADLNRFAVAPQLETTNIRRSFVLGYVGSVGTYYMFDEVVASFIQLRQLRPEARLLIVNLGQHQFIRERLYAAGVSDTNIELTSANHSEMPILMAQMDAAAFFIKPVFSKQASAPTKLAEFLGCGIPCLSNAGVGDMAEVLEGEKVGVALESFDPESIRAGLIRLLLLVQDPEIRGRCACAARIHFSLDKGVASYKIIYDSLES